MKEKCETFRAQCKEIENQVRALKTTVTVSEAAFNPEVPANLTLAIRHLEDARMRLGKAIQYMGDGVSIYDNIR
jgi:exonuclease VII small subunit